MGRLCEVGRCTRHDAERLGTAYACPGHRALIEQLTTQYLKDARS